MSIEWINDDDGALGLTKLSRGAKRRGATSTDDAGAFTEASLPKDIAPLFKQALLPPVRKKRRAQLSRWSPRAGKGYADSWAFMDHLRTALHTLLQRSKHKKSEPHVIATRKLFDRLDALNGAMATYSEATSPEVNAIVQAGKEVCLAAKACAEGASTKGQFRRLIATMAASSSRGVEPKDALKEVTYHVAALVEYHGDRNGWEDQILREGALYRTTEGGWERRTPTQILKRREVSTKQKQDTRDGRRKPKTENQTTAGHKKGFEKKIKNEAKRSRRQRSKFRKIPTPQYCIRASRIDEPVVQFKVQVQYVPDGFDNPPTSAEQAYKNALECFRLRGKKTAEERAAEKEKKLPKSIRPSKAKSRTGKYFVEMKASKTDHSFKIRSKFKSCFSVVKPGTDGYYSEKGAVKERDAFIKAGCPFEWCRKTLS